MSVLFGLGLFLCFVFLVNGAPKKESRDFYKILKISRSATEQEIKKAFKRLSVQLHPDKNPGNEEARLKYQEVSAAYEVLSDPEKRRVYDQYGEEGLKNDQGGGGFGGFDIFENFFGGGGGRAKKGELQKAPPQTIELQATLEDLYNGRDFEILQKRQVLCTHCRGTGADDPNDVQSCTSCGGTGQRIVEHKIGPGFVQRMQTTCDKCGGKGKVSKSVCSKCRGSKVQQGEQLLTIFIEKGMPEGYEIRSASDADENPGEEPGDLLFKITTAPHDRFVRKGNDLHMTLRISLLEALVGFEYSFNHLDGHAVPLKRTEVTPPGFVQILANEGMPIHGNTFNFGQLFITYQINFPESLTTEQKDGFKLLLK
jgi:DnaJ-related protein SCJ1